MRALGGNDWRKGLKLLRLVAYGLANLASGPRRRPAHMAAQLLGVPLLTPIQLMNQNRTVSGANPCRRLAIEATLNLDPPLATW